MLSEKYFEQILPRIIGVISMLFILVSITGCDKEINVADTLEVDNLSPAIGASGNEFTLNITSNATWKVGRIDAAWLHVDNAEGTGNGQLRLSCDPNNTVESREVEFYIVTTKDGIYHKIKLTQLASDPFITLEEQEIEVGSRPRSHAISLDTNIPTAAIEVEVVYEEDGESWVVGVHIEENTLKFQTVLNTVTEERAATVILSYTDISDDEIEVWDRLTVTQMASGNEPPAEIADFAYVKELPLGEIVENIYISGNIVSTGTSDNFRSGTYIIQDDNNTAIAFESIENLTLNKFDKVHLLLDGAAIETFEDSGIQYRVIRGINSANILLSEADPGFAPPTMRIDDLTEDHVLSLVTLQDVEFAMPYGGYSNIHEWYNHPTRIADYSDNATKHYPAPIRDISGDDIYLITNREVSYRRNAVPKGAGTVTGLIVKITNSAYGNLGTYSIRHLEESDIAMDANRANGFSEILVEWEHPSITGLPPASSHPNGAAPLPPTTGPSGAILTKDESSGLYAGNAANGIYLVEKYRGDYTNPGGTNAITNIPTSVYNVNSWGAGRYWLMDNVSTLGITTSLSLQFEANSGTGTGPRDFVVEYSLDGDTWINVGSYQLKGQITGGVSDHVIPGFRIYTYHLPDELLNQPNIMIRLMNISGVSVSGGTTPTGATSRLAHFSIKYNK